MGRRKIKADVDQNGGGPTQAAVCIRAGSGSPVIDDRY